MRLKPGEYFGAQLAQRRTSGVCLTLCRYPGNRKLPRHSHENPGFFFLLGGDHCETDEHRACVQPVSAMIYHAAGSSHENDIGPAGMVGLNISFDRNWMKDCELPLLSHRSGWVLEKPLAKANALQLLAGLSRENPSDLENISAELLELMDTCRSPKDASPPPWLKRARNKIEEEYASPLSLSAVALEVGVHPVYLARSFRRHYQRTFTSYLHEVRILKAVSLASCGMSLGQAAAECGFCDQGYLSRVVRGKLGVRPSDLNWFKSSKSNAAIAS